MHSLFKSIKKPIENWALAHPAQCSACDSRGHFMGKQNGIYFKNYNIVLKCTFSKTADGFYNFLLTYQHKWLTFSYTSTLITFDLCRLCGPRLVHSGSGCRSPSLGSDLTFATRTGSRQGIEMHLFRVETHRDLSTWTRILVQGCHAAAELIKEVSLGIDPDIPFLIGIKWKCYTLF